MEPATPTIETALGEFLEDQRARLATRTFERYRDIVELLTHCLNEYGHQALDRSERRRFEKAYTSDPEAFSRLFGPDKILDNYGEFLGYFMIRKVGYGGETLMQAAGTVTKKLAKWLVERGYVDPQEGEVAELGAAEAAHDLPRAERLSQALFELAHRGPGALIDPNELSDEDYQEDHMQISRVEPGKLWFDGHGPVAVPRSVSDLAQDGWYAYVELGRTRKGWVLLGCGSVYP